MKKSLLLTCLLLMAIAGFSQTNNMVLFSEGGERFTAILNGLRMNDAPVTNLKITDLNQPAYKLKVLFEDPALGELDKNLYFQDQWGKEVVFSIRKNRKGEYKVAYQSETTIQMAPPPPPTQQVIVFGVPAPSSTTVVEETMTTTGTMGGVNMNVNMQQSGTVVEQHHSTTTTTTTSPGGESINMSVGIDGFGMDVNVNTNDISSSTTTTTTMTTTTTSGSIAPAGDIIVVEESAPCPALGPGEFQDACASIRSKSFSDSKMTLARQVVSSHCVTSEQVRDMARLFDFEDDKLDFVRYAYDYTIDPEHFYKVNDVFTFESSIEELDEYLQSRR